METDAETEKNGVGAGAVAPAAGVRRAGVVFVVVSAALVAEEELVLFDELPRLAVAVVHNGVHVGPPLHLPSTV